MKSPRPGKQRSKQRRRFVDGHHIVFDDATSKRMGGIRQKDTTPELAVRRVLTACGLRYRIRNRDLPGSPDIANRAGKWAIFVHGCYWHRHAGCRRTTTPKRNAAFWIAKFDANVARDARTNAELRRHGYRTLTIWECETKEKNLHRVVAAFARRLAKRGDSTTATTRASAAVQARGKRDS